MEMCYCYWEYNLTSSTFIFITVMVIMSEKKVYVWFSEPRMSLQCWEWRKKAYLFLNWMWLWYQFGEEKKMQWEVSQLLMNSNKKFFKLLFHVNFLKIKYLKQFLNWFSLKSMYTFKSSIWPRLLWQSTVSMLIYIEFGRVVPLINSAVCGKNSSSVIAAVFLYPQMLCCLAVSLENDLRCSVQVSYGTDGTEVLHQRLWMSLTTCFSLLVFCLCMIIILRQTRKQFLTHFFKFCRTVLVSGPWGYW